MHTRVFLQSFWICLCVFLMAIVYSGFIRIPIHLSKFTMIACQLCYGSTAIVYVTMNKTIRQGVKNLLTSKQGRVSSATGARSTTGNVLA
ncbi:serpentine type 7TM GPCR chemoreceptor srt domain-containing protein [Ditylenchus destructor]|nr:serpentine type 7TM GPCR chemoreceptor srt domain-containing protein [Ditylenchus destructor]